MKFISSLSDKEYSLNEIMPSYAVNAPSYEAYKRYNQTRYIQGTTTPLLHDTALTSFEQNLLQSEEQLNLAMDIVQGKTKGKINVFDLETLGDFFERDKNKFLRDMSAITQFGLTINENVNGYLEKTTAMNIAFGLNPKQETAAKKFIDEIYGKNGKAIKKLSSAEIAMLNQLSIIGGYSDVKDMYDVKTLGQATFINMKKAGEADTYNRTKQLQGIENLAEIHRAYESGQFTYNTINDKGTVVAITKSLSTMDQIGQEVASRFLNPSSVNIGYNNRSFDNEVLLRSGLLGTGFNWKNQNGKNRFLDVFDVIRSMFGNNAIEKLEEIAEQKGLQYHTTFHATTQESIAGTQGLNKGNKAHVASNDTDTLSNFTLKVRDFMDGKSFLQLTKEKISNLKFQRQNRPATGRDIYLVNNSYAIEKNGFEFGTDEFGQIRGKTSPYQMNRGQIYRPGELKRVTGKRMSAETTLLTTGADIPGAIPRADGTGNKLTDVSEDYFQLKLINVGAERLNGNDNEAVYLTGTTKEEIFDKLEKFTTRKILVDSQEDLTFWNKHYASMLVDEQIVEDATKSYQLDNARRFYDSMFDVKGVGSFDTKTSIGGYSDFKLVNTIMQELYTADPKTFATRAGIDKLSRNQLKNILIKTGHFGYTDKAGNQKIVTSRLNNFIGILPRLVTERETNQVIVNAIDRAYKGVDNNYLKTVALSMVKHSLDIPSITKTSLSNITESLTEGNNLSIAKEISSITLADSVINLETANTAAQSLNSLISGDNSILGIKKLDRFDPLYDIKRTNNALRLTEYLFHEELINKKQFTNIRKSLQQKESANVWTHLRSLGSMLVDQNTGLMEEMTTLGYADNLINQGFTSDELQDMMPEYAPIIRKKQFSLHQTNMDGDQYKVNGRYYTTDRIVNKQKLKSFVNKTVAIARQNGELSFELDTKSFEDANSPVNKMLYDLGYQGGNVPTPNPKIQNPTIYSLQQRMGITQARGLKTAFFAPDVEGANGYMITASKDRLLSVMEEIVSGSQNLKTARDVTTYMEGFKSSALVEPIYRINTEFGGPQNYPLQLFKQGDMTRAVSLRINTYTDRSGELHVRQTNSLDEIYRGTFQMNSKKIFGYIEEGNYGQANRSLNMAKNAIIKKARGLSSKVTYTMKGKSRKTVIPNINDLHASALLNIEELQGVYEYILKKEKDTDFAAFLEYAGGKNLNSNVFNEIKLKTLTQQTIGEAIGTVDQEGSILGELAKLDGTESDIKRLEGIRDGNLGHMTMLDYLASNEFLQGKPKDTKLFFTQFHDQMKRYGSQRVKEHEINDYVSLSDKSKISAFSYKSPQNRPVYGQDQSYKYIEWANAEDRVQTAFGRDVTSFGIRRGGLVREETERNLIDSTLKAKIESNYGVLDTLDKYLIDKVSLNAKITSQEAVYKTFEQWNGLSSAVRANDRAAAQKIFKSIATPGTSFDDVWNLFSDQKTADDALSIMRHITNHAGVFESRNMLSPMAQMVFLSPELQNERLFDPNDGVDSIKWTGDLGRAVAQGESFHGQFTLRNGQLIGLKSTRAGQKEILWNNGNAIVSDLERFFQRGELEYLPEDISFGGAKISLGNNEKASVPFINYSKSAMETALNKPLSDQYDVSFAQKMWNLMFGEDVHVLSDAPISASGHASGAFPYGNIINNIATLFSTDATRNQEILQTLNSYMGDMNFRLYRGQLLYTNPTKLGSDAYQTSVSEAFNQMVSDMESGNFGSSAGLRTDAKTLYAQINEQSKRGIYTVDARRLNNQESLAEKMSFDDRLIQNQRGKYKYYKEQTQWGVRDDGTIQAPNGAVVNGKFQYYGEYLNDYLTKQRTVSYQAKSHMYQTNMKGIINSFQFYETPDKALNKQGFLHVGIEELNLINMESSEEEIASSIFGIWKQKGPKSFYSPSKWLNAKAKEKGYMGQANRITNLVVDLGFQLQTDLDGSGKKQTIDKIVIPVLGFIKDDLENGAPIDEDTKATIQLLKTVQEIVKFKSEYTPSEVNERLEVAYQRFVNRMATSAMGHKDGYLKQKFMKIPTRFSGESGAAGTSKVFFAGMMDDGWETLSLSEREAMFEKNWNDKIVPVLRGRRTDQEAMELFEKTGMFRFMTKEKTLNPDGTVTEKWMVANRGYGSVGFFEEKGINFEDFGKQLYNERNKLHGQSKYDVTPEFISDFDSLKKETDRLFGEIKAINKKLKKYGKRNNKDADLRAALYVQKLGLQDELKQTFKEMGMSYAEKIGFYGTGIRYPIIFQDSIWHLNYRLDRGLQGNSVMINPLAQVRLNLDFDGDRIFAQLFMGKNGALLNKNSDLYKMASGMNLAEQIELNGAQLENLYEAAKANVTAASGKWGFANPAYSVKEALWYYQIQEAERLAKEKYEIVEDNETLPDGRTRARLRLKRADGTFVEAGSAEHMKLLRGVDNFSTNKSTILLETKTKANKLQIGLYSNANQKVKNMLDSLINTGTVDSETKNFLNGFIRRETAKAESFLNQIEQRIIDVKHTTKGANANLNALSYLQSVRQMFQENIKAKNRIQAFNTFTTAIDEKFISANIGSRDINNWDKDQTLAEWVIHFKTRQEFNDAMIDANTFTGVKNIKKMREVMVGIRDLYDLSNIQEARDLFNKDIGIEATSMTKVSSMLQDYFNIIRDKRRTGIYGTIQKNAPKNPDYIYVNGMRLDDKKMAFYTINENTASVYNIHTKLSTKNDLVEAELIELNPETLKKLKKKKQVISGTAEEVSKKLSNMFFDPRKQALNMDTMDHMDGIRNNIAKEQAKRAISRGFVTRNLEETKKIMAVMDFVNTGTNGKGYQYLNQAGYIFVDVNGNKDFKPENMGLSTEGEAFIYEMMGDNTKLGKERLEEYGRMYGFFDGLDIKRAEENANRIDYLATNLIAMPNGTINQNSGIALESMVESIVEDKIEQGMNADANDILEKRMTYDLKTQADLNDPNSTQKVLKDIDNMMASNQSSTDEMAKLFGSKLSSYRSIDLDNAKTVLENYFQKITKGIDLDPNVSDALYEQVVKNTLGYIKGVNQANIDMVRQILGQYSSRPDVMGTYFGWNGAPAEAIVGYGEFYGTKLKDLSEATLRQLAQGAGTSQGGAGYEKVIQETASLAQQYLASNPNMPQADKVVRTQLSDDEILGAVEDLENINRTIQEKAKGRTTSTNGGGTTGTATGTYDPLKRRTINNGTGTSDSMFKNLDSSDIKGGLYALAALGIVTSIASVINQQSTLTAREDNSYPDEIGSVAPATGQKEVYVDSKSGLSFNVSAHANRFLTDSTYRQTASAIPGYDTTINVRDNREEMDKRWVLERFESLI